MKAHAKLNLALVVGSTLPSGKHELTTVFQELDLADDVELEPVAGPTVVGGFPDDSLVSGALALLTEAAGVEQGFHVRLVKRIPVAAGLGGGSSDAATALRLANACLPEPLPPADLAAIASRLGADVPFFLEGGSQLGEGDGGELTPLPSLPRDYAVLLLRPYGTEKESTGAVYRAFDRRGGGDGYDARRAALLEALAAARASRDLAALPQNDLAASPLAVAIVAAGAFRADVSGAGPTLYGLFDSEAAAAAAADGLGRLGATVVTRPVGPRAAGW